MLLYFYVREYEDGLVKWDHDDPSDIGPMWENIGLYSIADKYNIAPLKELAKKKITKNLKIFNQYASPNFLNTFEPIYNPGFCSGHGLRDCLVPLFERLNMSCRFKPRLPLSSKKDRGAEILLWTCCVPGLRQRSQRLR